MEFSLETATTSEIECIQHWSDAKTCKAIRNVYYFPDTKTSDAVMCDVRTLEQMFEKYDSALDKKETIYRGLRFKKGEPEKVELFELLLNAFKHALDKGDTVAIDKAPTSFTRIRSVAADEFALAKNQSYFSLIFELTFRTSSEIDIKAGMNRFEYQKEVIIRSQHAIYRVESIKNEEYDTIVITIREEE